ncbi:MAG TPA: hypothetical protein VFM98_00790 [Ramlibacter sp.]|uniref:hypothetical protein n=1 Tax=Ramlibacter sp. TaxID=1917967 RepID=UPI002D7E5E39|nr:hypothetical protein [Ramlibacter sp.]HET8744111.1 hypothetical protein [Ramlibacter sp.]
MKVWFCLAVLDEIALGGLQRADDGFLQARHALDVDDLLDGVGVRLQQEVVLHVGVALLFCTMFWHTAMIIEHFL